jgi:hypothetical protein
MGSQSMIRKADGNLRPAVYSDFVAKNVARQKNGLFTQLEVAAKRRNKQ